MITGGSRRTPTSRRRSRSPFVAGRLVAIAASIVATVLLVTAGGSASPAHAGDAPTSTVPPEPVATEGETVRVAIRRLPPFVESSDGGYTGLTIELWEETAERLGVTTEYLEVENVGEQLEALRTGRADVAATAISVTDDREEEFDFSYVYFESGLQIMVPADQRVSFASALRALTEPAVLSLALVFAIAVVVVGLVVWLLERRTNPDFSGHGRLRGAEEGLWWAIVTVATVGYGDRVTRRSSSRLIAVLWILFGLVFIAQFTATITANLTLEELASSIDGPEDLPGREVAAVEGTTSAEYLDDQGIAARTVPTVQELVDLVADDAVEAAVYDAPVLLYEQQRVGSDRVALVGTRFTYEGYAIALPEGSPLLEPIDRALLAEIEDGSYARLRASWFPGEG